ETHAWIPFDVCQPILETYTGVVNLFKAVQQKPPPIPPPPPSPSPSPSSSSPQPVPTTSTSGAGSPSETAAGRTATELGSDMDASGVEGRLANNTSDNNPFTLTPLDPGTVPDAAIAFIWTLCAGSPGVPKPLFK
ncbi:hypothetical protein HK102_008715, partial [Quaeritorhiza haematococci]